LILLGGATAVGDGYIGYEETANNNGVVVSGSGSTWTADYIGIGEVGSDNYVTVSNNGLINSFSITVGTSDNANNTLTVGDGGIVSAEDLTIESGGSAQVWAGGRLNVLYVFGNLSIAGIFAPGVTTGSSELNGSLNLSPSASLEMEIGGLGGVNSDHLEVTGSATLGGELKVILAGGFNPAIDDTFDLLDLTGGVSGTFDSINLPALGGEKSWDTTLLYTEGKLSVVFGPADLDGNGIADTWEQAYFGGTVDPDGNPDNDVQNNLQEYIAGTDPTNSASYFQVSQSGYDDVAGGYVLQWPVVSNRYYTVSWRDDLVFGTSSNLLENAELPQNSYTDTVHSAGNQRFYSVDVRTK
jgi:hypothetical protein